MGMDPMDAIIRNCVSLDEVTSLGEQRIAELNTDDPLLVITTSLRFVADLADSLAKYLDSCASLADVAPVPTLARLRACFPSNSTIKRIVHAAYVPMPHLHRDPSRWHREWELFVRFSYYRASYSAGSSVFAALDAFGVWTDEQPQGPALTGLWEDILRYFSDPSLGAGMRRLAARARALTEPRGQADKESEIRWWLERPDEYPEQRGIPRLEQYLESCPDPSDARVRDRLRLIATGLDVRKENRARALAILGEGERDAL